MKIIFLGTGTSTGIPVIGCHCRVCRSHDEKNKRLRSSVYLKKEHTAVVIDTGPDFRAQMLQHKIEKLDAALITHTHKDHIAGLDDAKLFAVINQRPFPIYGNKHSLHSIKNEFAYAFESFRYPGIPDFELHEIENDSFTVKSMEIIPVPVKHFRLPILGYRIDNMAYITDASSIPDTSLKQLCGLDILVVNALRIEPHIAHFTLQEALGMVEKIAPKRAYLTHASHYLGCHSEVSAVLPENVWLAYDGLEINTAD